MILFYIVCDKLINFGMLLLSAYIHICIQVIFCQGELLCGVLDKSQFGASQYGFVHSVYEVHFHSCHCYCNNITIPYQMQQLLLYIL